MYGIAAQNQKSGEHKTKPLTQKKKSIQTKLTVGSPNDRYEREADHMANRIMRMPQSFSGLGGLSSAQPSVQRKCSACTQEEDIQRKPLMLKSEGGTPVATPALASQLSSSKGGGNALPGNTNQFMSQAFGADFSSVRIHNDGRAAQMNQNLHARAFTHGADIYFNRGEYSPDSASGKHLLAHELTHVVQQSGGAQSIQRACEITAPPASMTCAAAVNSTSGVSLDVMFAEDSYSLSAAAFADISNFAHNWHSLGVTETVRIDGYASCDGSPDSNWLLSCNRANEVAAELETPSDGTAGVPRPYIDILANGESERFGMTPEPNRLSQITVSAVAPTPPSTPTTPTPAPAFRCGPDVTTEVEDAVTKTKTTFAGWSTADKETGCQNLIGLTTGGVAWDIIELHNNAWIHLNYRPACATVGASPPCGSTVQVGSGCHYAGSPNYVIYGVMMKLCNAHYTSTGATSDANDFTLAEVNYWINVYKGTGFTGLGTPSGNFVPSRQWANAGYNGWPAVSSPAGDRPGCDPSCPTSYSGAAFRVHWLPNIF